MFRFTIRELVLLTVIVAMGAGWWSWHQRALENSRRQEQAQRERVKAILDLHHFERVVSTTNALDAVAVKRCSAAASELSARIESYSAGQSYFDDAAEAVRRFAASGLPQDQVRRLTIAIALSKLLEEIVQSRYDSHAEPIQPLLEAKSTRRGLEIRLVTLQENKPQHDPH